MTEPTHSPDPTRPMIDSQPVLERLAAYRSHDAPTHGGSVLSYVYDSGLAELDSLAASAAAMAMPVNGLDPTTFPSVALMEADLITFGRAILHGPQAVGSVTSGGTESCLLAVKAARERWRATQGERGSGRPRIVLASSAHAAFHKAADYLGLDLDVVPVDPVSGVPDAADFVERLTEQTALVVVSSTPWPRSPAPRPHAGSRATWTPASVGWCCPSGPMREVCRQLSGTSRSRG